MRALFVCFALVILACGGQLAPPEPGCVDVYDAVFRWNARCGVGTPSNALDRAKLFCSGIAGMEGVRFDAEPACARALDKADCGRFPHECVELQAGTLAAGQPCVPFARQFVIHSPCRSGVCEVASGTTCGKCAVAALEGAECGSGTPCAPGLTCKIAAAQTMGVCVAAGAHAGDPCSTATDCLADTYCNYNTRVCTAREPPAAKCWSGYECASGSTCNGNPGTCTQPAAIRESCTFKDCAPGLVCRLEVCEAPTLLQMGEACGQKGSCIVGACNTSNVCPEIDADDAACGDLGTCDAFSACIANTCRLPKPHCD